MDPIPSPEFNVTPVLRQHALGIDGPGTAIPDEVIGDAGKEEWGQARPAIANKPLSVNRASQVVRTLKTAYRDGTSHIELFHAA